MPEVIPYSCWCFRVDKESFGNVARGALSSIEYLPLHFRRPYAVVRFLYRLLSRLAVEFYYMKVPRRKKVYVGRAVATRDTWKLGLKSAYPVADDLC